MVSFPVEVEVKLQFRYVVTYPTLYRYIDTAIYSRLMESVCVLLVFFPSGSLIKIFNRRTNRVFLK